MQISASALLDVYLVRDLIHPDNCHCRSRSTVTCHAVILQQALFKRLVRTHLIRLELSVLML